MRYENHHMPATIPAGHVRVLMRAVGICGSDVHFYKKVSPQQPSPNKLHRPHRIGAAL